MGSDKKSDPIFANLDEKTKALIKNGSSYSKVTDAQKIKTMAENVKNHFCNSSSSSETEVLKDTCVNYWYWATSLLLKGFDPENKMLKQDFKTCETEGVIDNCEIVENAEIINKTQLAKAQIKEIYTQIGNDDLYQLSFLDQQKSS
jgi:hypothetical protein